MYLGMIMQVVFAEQSEEELMGHCLDWGLLCYKKTNIISSLSATGELRYISGILLIDQQASCLKSHLDNPLILCIINCL